MKEVSKVLAFCDAEEEYAHLMTEFLKKHKDLPWEIHTYTNIEDLISAQSGEIVILLIAESSYQPCIQDLNPLKLIILNESGILRWKDLTYIDKYQPAEEVLRSLLQIYMEIADTPLPRFGKVYQTKFIGIYTPIHRSLQTSMALTMSQILAKDHTTLYINLEYCAGIGELLPDMKTLDIADLLVFLNAEKEKFRLRLRTICQHLGNLDYVPPIRVGQNLLSITSKEWISLIQKIEDLGEYEYVVLDLSDCVQGLFDILRLCEVIYTLQQNDRISQSKILQYEQLLKLYEFDDVLKNTRHVDVPKIRKISGELDQYTRGELADWVNNLLEEVNSWNMQS